MHLLRLPSHQLGSRGPRAGAPGLAGRGLAPLGQGLRSACDLPFGAHPEADCFSNPQMSPLRWEGAILTSQHLGFWPRVTQGLQGPPEKSAPRAAAGAWGRWPADTGEPGVALGGASPHAGSPERRPALKGAAHLRRAQDLLLGCVSTTLRAGQREAPSLEESEPHPAVSTVHFSQKHFNIH